MIGSLPVQASRPTCTPSDSPSAGWCWPSFRSSSTRWRWRCRDGRTSRTTSWKPELGTRFTLVDRASGEATGGFQTDACFAFHHVNAFEDGDEVVVDMCAYPDAGIIEDLYLERLRAGKPMRRAELTRFRLGWPTARSPASAWPRATSSCLASTTGAATSAPTATSGARPRRARLAASRSSRSTSSDGATLWWSQEDCYPGEPVFVARPERRAVRTTACCCRSCSTRAPELDAARAGCRRPQRAGARGGAAPHPLRLPRPVRAAATPPRRRAGAGRRLWRRCGSVWLSGGAGGAIGLIHRPSPQPTSRKVTSPAYMADRPDRRLRTVAAIQPTASARPSTRFLERSGGGLEHRRARPTTDSRRWLDERHCGRTRLMFGETVHGRAEFGAYHEFQAHMVKVLQLPVLHRSQRDVRAALDEGVGEEDLREPFTAQGRAAPNAVCWNNSTRGTRSVRGEQLEANGVIDGIDEHLATIAVPAVVIQGADDQLVKPMYGRSWRRAADARLEIVSGGHMAPYAHPAAVAGAALDGATVGGCSGFEDCRLRRLACRALRELGSRCLRIGPHDAVSATGKISSTARPGRDACSRIAGLLLIDADGAEPLDLGAQPQRGIQRVFRPLRVLLRASAVQLPPARLTNPSLPARSRKSPSASL